MTGEEIYKENYPIVYGYLLSLCGNVDVAEDLTAETFLKAFQHPKRYDGSCKLSTWLCTIARNLYYNEHKRQKRRHSLWSHSHVQPDPEAAMIHKETVGRLWQTARQLEAPYNQVFFMRLEGLSFRQIGEVMDILEEYGFIAASAEE